MDKKLADQLFFSKEAAEYLGITPQRLNVLIKEGKIEPLKKNSSGTIFHIDELEKRKKEMMIFSKVNLEAVGMFQFDNKTKREALNFAILMNVLDKTEQSLDEPFSEFAKMIDTTELMSESAMIGKYASFFNVSEQSLLNEFERAYKAFSNLMSDDEIVGRDGHDYPELLRKTQQAPRYLFLRGNKSLLFEKRTVALVGSRQASDRAKENTRRLVNVLGKNGITIVSGLAKGIDVTAHKAALERGYNTIAVIGTNLNQYYPAENRDVQKEIEQKGLVVSQFSPASETKRWFFPLRNGVMSGLSLATVVMEAGETSGALKQADYALKQNRQVMIPQSALEMESISWPARYQKRGAHVVHTANDVLRILAEKNIYIRNNSEMQYSISETRSQSKDISYNNDQETDWLELDDIGG